MRTEILCTLGPASLNERVIKRLESVGVSLFRINLSHTELAQLEGIIRKIQAWTDVPICLDTEGAQVRTGPFVTGGVALHENATVTAHSRRVPGDSLNFSLYPAGVVDMLKPGDFISIDFDAVLTQVLDVKPGQATMRVLNGGKIAQNKAVTVHRALPLSPLTEKDKAAIAIGRRHGIRHVALSFANRASDIDEVRALAGKDTFVISKVECCNALENLADIVTHSEAILIDRGDLSREVPLERIPATQKMIIRTGKKLGRKVYVATNLLESMVSSPSPTRAEVNDIFNTMADGADGLVLAAETAIGAYPVHCANMVVKLIREFESWTDDAWRKPADAFSMLVPPHGGQLVQSHATLDEVGKELPRVTVSVRELSDCEQIAFGTYSPLEGFMDRATLLSVLESFVLPSGVPWTLPIVLPVDTVTARRLSPGHTIALCTSGGVLHSLLDVTEIYPIEFDRLVKPWFGTTSTDHPGVAWLSRAGSHFVAGRVRLLQRRESPYQAYELPPAQTRFILAHKGWSRVVGFHSRNVVHRAHEHIQLAALDRVHADGLFISPVLGERKAGDFLPGPIIRSYEAMLNFGLYPKGKVVLGAFFTYPRYCGPREAIFTALCRKNMGCSHFVIGRDHTGVGSFYGPDENRRLFDRLGDIGIEPIFFDSIGYDEGSGRYVSLNEVPNALAISGTAIRDALVKNEPVPEWQMRGVVQDALREDIAAGQPLFQS